MDLKRPSSPVGCSCRSAATTPDTGEHYACLVAFSHVRCLIRGHRPQPRSGREAWFVPPLPGDPPEDGLGCLGNAGSTKRTCRVIAKVWPWGTTPV